MPLLFLLSVILLNEVNKLVNLCKCKANGCVSTAVINSYSARISVRKSGAREGTLGTSPTHS